MERTSSATREKVRVAHALDRLPSISAAMACGELNVETLVPRFRRVQEVQELDGEQRQHINRGLTHFHDDDGSLVVRLRLPAESSALLLGVLDAALTEVPLPELPCEDASWRDRGQSPHCEVRLDDSAETLNYSLSVGAGASRQDDLPSLSARRADALLVLAESFRKHGAAALSGGERHQIVVHVDAESLQARAEGRCEIDDGPAISLETARRPARDARVVRIIETGEGEPLDVGRRTRSIPPALRRAARGLWATGGHWSPGIVSRVCTSTRRPP
jgi:hypothetical protein